MAQLQSLSIGRNTVADFVVEQGTSGIWTYRKYNSGIVEMYATPMAHGAKADNLSVSTINSYELPFKLSGNVSCNVNVFSEEGWKIKKIYSKQITNANNLEVDMYTESDIDTVTNIYISIIIIGYWK